MILIRYKYIWHLELCLLGTHISTYPTISQGKTRIPGVNDGEEFELVHVSHKVTSQPMIDLFVQIDSIEGSLNYANRCKYLSRFVQFFVAGSWNAIQIH